MKTLYWGYCLKCEKCRVSDNKTHCEKGHKYNLSVPMGRHKHYKKRDNDGFTNRR